MVEITAKKGNTMKDKGAKKPIGDCKDRGV